MENGTSSVMVLFSLLTEIIDQRGVMMIKVYSYAFDDYLRRLDQMSGTREFSIIKS